MPRIGAAVASLGLAVAAVLLLTPGTAAIVGHGVRYTAAVVEHVTNYTVRNVTRAEAVEIMMDNLGSYAGFAREAAAAGADIVVFPEDGVYGFDHTRETALPYLEPIPEPNATFVPCESAVAAVELPVLHFLSCMALDNGLAVVANVGDVQPCARWRPPSACPGDGRLQFNTDVAFDTDGRLLAKYHKFNLFGERQFDTPLHPSRVHFETSFGVRFGVFTCFDLLFAEPALALAQALGLRDIVFPTAWMGGRPTLRATQYQQAWSRATGTVLLAANQHMPAAQMSGSGIYSAGEPLGYFSGADPLPTRGRLIVRNITAAQSPRASQGVTRPDAPVPPPLATGHDFLATMQNDPFGMRLLGPGPSGTVSVCYRGLCCTLDYERAAADSAASSPTTAGPSDMFALGAYRGLHEDRLYGLEICALVTCDPSNITPCGQTSGTSTVFSRLVLTGNFSAAAFTFPSAQSFDFNLLTNAELVATHHNRLELNSTRPLLSAILFGRTYAEDRASF